MLEIECVDERYFVIFAGCVMYAAYTLSEAKSWLRDNIQNFKGG